MPIKTYLQLFRIPNIFTVPADIMAGYFIILTGYTNATIQNAWTENAFIGLVTLIFSSIFLYLGGIVSNDLFDIKIDKMQRSTRPLASGAASKNTAVLFCLILFSLGIYLSTLVGFTSFFISIILTVGILFYNYKIKNGFFRPFLMGGLRFLNVIYGATLGFNFLETIWPGESWKVISLPTFETEPSTPLGLLIICSSAVFVHIFTLTWISSKETKSEYTKQDRRQKTRIQHIYFIYLLLLTVLGVISITLLPNPLIFSFFYTIFFILAILSFYFAFIRIDVKVRTEKQIQNLVRNQIIMLILLDASFIAGTSGFINGFLGASLLIPCFVLAKKIKMT